MLEPFAKVGVLVRPFTQLYAGGIGNGFARVSPQARVLTQQGLSRRVRVCASIAAPPKEEKMVAAMPQVREVSGRLLDIYEIVLEKWAVPLGYI